MTHALAELAELVGGDVVGDAGLQIAGANPPATVVAGEITLIDSRERLKKLADCPAAAVVMPPGLATSLPAIVVDDPHSAFAKIVALYRPAYVHPRIGVSPRAVVSPKARLSADVDVHPFAVIGDDVEIAAGCVIHSGVQVMAGSKLGQDVVIFPNAVLYENTIIGARCIIHAGVVIGAYGFGFKTVAGRHRPTPQLGYVEIGADVEIGANSTIDRGTYGATRVGEGTKLDDLVMIGHNCQIGKHNLLCALAGIAGSSSTGDYVVMAGSSGAADHVRIGHKAVVCGMSGAMNDVADGAVVFGIPAMPKRERYQEIALMARLPEMRRQLKALEKTTAELRQRLIDGEGDRTAAA